VGEKELSYTAGGNVSTTTMENNMEWKLLKTLNINLPYNAEILLLETYPQECDSGYYKGTCTPMFIAALFTISKVWKQPRFPTTNKWIKIMWYLYTKEIYSASRKMKFCHSQANGWNWRTSF
jgi:hypothetical protein